MKYTVASLFAGIGCIDRAFAEAGFDITAQVEIDSYCQQVLRKHAPSRWPNARILSDVTQIKGSDIGAVDVMVGGFPCQPVSVAGSRKAQADERWLWPHFERLIGEVRPRFVLLENVPGILHAVKHTRTTYAFQGKARIYQRQLTYYTQAPVYEVLAGLAALGYDTAWGIISAASVGAPHRRDRWFCVAYANGFGRYRQTTLNRCASNCQRHLPTPEPTRRTIIHEIIASSQAMGDATGIAGSMAAGSERQHLSDAEGTGQAMGDAQCTRLQGGAGSELQQTKIFAEGSGRDAQSVFRRGVDVLRSGVHQYRWPSRPDEPQAEWEAPRTTTIQIAHRRKRIEALGNAVVWPVVYPFALAIREALESQS